MLFCINCGQQLPEGAKFCSKCGTSINSNSNTSRQQEWAGQLIQCPSCGEILRSFEPVCSFCGYEIRNAKATNSMLELSQKLAQAKSNDERIIYIRSFPIPNTKEDIIEVMTLSASNMVDNYQEEISQAWQMLFERAYQKAEIMFGDSPEIQKSREYFESNIQKIRIMQQQKQKEIHFRQLEQAKKEKNNERKLIKKEKRQYADIQKERKYEFLNKHSDYLVYFGGLVVCIFIFFAVPVLIGEISHKNKVKTLEKSVKQIEEYIDNEDYDNARIKANQLILSGNWSSDEEKKWDNIRNSLLDIINEKEALSQGKIKVNFIQKDFKKNDYLKVEEILIQQGFTNITLSPIDDLLTGWITKDGQVEEVTIDGRTDYEKDTYISSDAEIIIYYHTFKEKD